MSIFDSIQINNITPNPLPAKKLDDKILGIVVYPEPLKRYSINAALKERDEFRNSVIQNTQRKEKRTNFGKKFLFVAACVVTAGIFSFIKTK